MKKILILVLGCHDNFFEEQCKIIKQTWAKPIIEGKYPNIDFLIYYGEAEKNKLDKKNNELHIRVEDGLDNTFKKTYYAFSLVNSNIEYDYIFRTNTSTFINVDALNAFVQNITDDSVLWCSELYSLTEAFTPYPLNLFGRGNGLLFSKKLIDIILYDGINFLYMNTCDDWTIGNILNSYWIKNKENYLDHIKGFKHGWFKCIGTNANNNNSLCPYYNSNTNFDFLNQFITIQIKRYREREKENNNYIELWNIFENHEDTNYNEVVVDNLEYSKNPNVFIGSILGYIDYNYWDSIDKSKLFTLEIYNKACDDAECYKDKKTLY